MALSLTSNTMWWRPEPSSVSPIYIPGRLRTASRPFRTLIESAPYSVLTPFSVVGISVILFENFPVVGAEVRLANHLPYTCQNIGFFIQVPNASALKLAINQG